MQVMLFLKTVDALAGNVVYTFAATIQRTIAAILLMERYVDRYVYCCLC